MVREFSDRLFDLMDEGAIDSKSLAQSLIYWISESSIREFVRANDYELDDIDPDDDWEPIDAQAGND